LVLPFKPEPFIWQQFGAQTHGNEIRFLGSPGKGLHNSLSK